MASSSGLGVDGDRESCHDLYRPASSPFIFVRYSDSYVVSIYNTVTTVDFYVIFQQQRICLHFSETHLICASLSKTASAGDASIGATEIAPLHAACPLPMHPRTGILP